MVAAFIRFGLFVLLWAGKNPSIVHWVTKGGLRHWKTRDIIPRKSSGSSINDNAFWPLPLFSLPQSNINLSSIFAPSLHVVFKIDFTRPFLTTNKCNNINHVRSHFHKILVVLKYHRRLWANIFDTDICRSINIPKKAKYTTLM